MTLAVNIPQISNVILREKLSLLSILTINIDLPGQSTFLTFLELFHVVFMVRSVYNDLCIVTLKVQQMFQECESYTSLM